MASSVPVAAESSGEYDFAIEARSHSTLVRQRFVRHRLAVASLFVLAGLLAAGLFAGRIAPYTYQELDITSLSSGPTWEHPFGTDQIGRDYFSRALHGLGTEVRIALLVAFFGTLAGTLIGALAGYYGRAFDNVAMRLTDLALTLPPLITLLVAAAYLQTDTLFEVSLLLAAVLWMPLARIVRGSSLALRDREYVDAARALGASDTRIIFRHVLPNTMSAVAVAASTMAAAAVIIETTLAYLGLGVNRYYGGRTDTASPSLGDVMAAASNEGLFNWWGIVFPGLTIVLLVMPIMFIGDGLRDAFDPTARSVAARPRRRKRRRLVPTGVRAAVAHARIGDRLGDAVHLAARPLRPVFAAATWARLVGGDALASVSRRSRRRRGGAARLFFEAIAVLVLTSGAAAAVYAWKVNPTNSTWRAAGTAVQNVSRARGAQTQVSVAIDPSSQNVLFAASNDSLLRSVRVYASADAGRTWTSSEGPAIPAGGCVRRDPSVAVAPDGSQYVAFTVNAFCTAEDPYPYLAVAGRAGPGEPWRVTRVAPPAIPDGYDDRPALAAGPDGRVHVAWSRLIAWTRQTTVISSSGDGGRTWSRPRIVHRALVQPQLVSLAGGPDGTLYVTGVDARFGIWVARSTGADSFEVKRAARLPASIAAACITSGTHPFAAQSQRCLGPNPTVTVTGDSVFVTSASAFDDPAQDVHVAVFDLELRPLGRRRVTPPDPSSDQFWPAAAFDADAELLWVCFYDTSGDPSRKRAWYSCATSRDGRRWSEPVRAAHDSANRTVLWEDARIYAFGDIIGFGGYTSLAATNGVAHPMWIATGVGDDHEVFTARINSRG